jgi:hypothetical protein
MFELFVFRRLLQYVLGRVVDVYDFAAVFGSWRHLRVHHSAVFRQRIYFKLDLILLIHE